jgi:very-short-patch-repair endonuclease
VAKIGKGTGKSAPRFRLAAQEAAKEASSAAPVWIMPEYKIPEQLPPRIGDFDLVILDEASQSDITALAALLRGKSILIVGDEEQVSPSNVAIPIQRINALRADCLTGLPNANLIDENTSIFEIARRMHPDTHVVLKEHFRCVAPIIQFSTQFYANRLIPLRVPKASERFDPPLVDVYTKGAERQDQTNESEARYVVNEVARIIADPGHKNRDIGVISLIGNEQAQKIERMLIEDRRIGTEAITEHRIICGDARTMQGQERSVVFLSMVATPGKAHAQTRKADQQRINVAMSRARDRLYLVRSVSLEDLSPADIKTKVLQHLQDPMPEGRSAISSGTSDGLFAKCQSGFEREVLTLLLEANYRVRPQVKAGGFFIDLVIEGAEDRRLAVELDGDANHGPEVWEKDMARQAALERAGWTFWRVFGSQWNAQKAYWWQDLKDTLTRMGIEPIGMGQLDERFTEFRTADSFLLH